MIFHDVQTQSLPNDQLDNMHNGLNGEILSIISIAFYFSILSALQ